MPSRTLRSGTPRLRPCGRHFAALALALTASSATAQRRQPILSIGFGGGAVMPVGKAQDDFKSGYTGQGFLLVHLGPLPALRFNLSFQKFDYKERARTSLCARERAGRHGRASRSVFFPDPFGPTSPPASARSV